MKQLGISIGIVVVAVAVGAVIVFSVQDNDIATQKIHAVPAENGKSQIDIGDYQEEVQKIVSEFRAQPTIDEAEDAHTLLLALRVPKEHKDLHLDLVLYFNAQIQNKSVDTASLQSLVAQVSWLSF